MPKNRLEAFTDGVIAIIITVMVLELHAPSSGTWAALWEMRGIFAIYFVSFFTLAVYWNNHHHLFLLVKRINGRVLWANILFLFAASFFPFATDWVGAAHVLARAPEMTYGIVVLATDVTYWLLIQTLIRADRHNAALRDLLGHGYYKPIVTIGGNVIAILAAFIWPTLTIIIDVLLLLLWVRPERRIEHHVHVSSSLPNQKSHQ
ncbi:TMEM175 family protein [Lacticaseibacillus camelliae]|uniref:Integral membrane protein n=1 Tax=Lacticaseibacillus camelliae DSM 22697 = JCM 13995 TaxID=1423730 RepID=A0A0R2F950_9LACO|nr:TMEM175 family protein [Lacticaseibacillus camelliae]KRN24866.1 integral membrane protein [Lacticaseibacillus camelliae DSM 22697 = JCM 13995]